MQGWALYLHSLIMTPRTLPSNLQTWLYSNPCPQGALVLAKVPSLLPVTSEVAARMANSPAFPLALKM